MGKSPKDAAVDGISEVRLAVLAITFMLCVALLPLAFSGGIVQFMFEGIVWAIILALLSSALVSFTLDRGPGGAICSSPTARRPRKTHGWFQRRLLDPSQRFLERLEARYRGGLALVHHETASSSWRAPLATDPGRRSRSTRSIGSEMMPLADVSQAFVQLEASAGDLVRPHHRRSPPQVEQLLLAKQPEVVKVSSEVGFEPGGTYFTGYSMGSVNSAFMMLTLVDSSKRQRDIWQVIDRVREEAIRTHPRHPPPGHQGDGRRRHGLERRPDPGDLLRPGAGEAVRRWASRPGSSPRRSPASTR